MADDTFDRDAAARRQGEIIDRVRRVRESIVRNVIDYYSERRPRSEGEERDYRRDMYRILKDADTDIHRLLDDLY